MPFSGEPLDSAATSRVIDAGSHHSGDILLEGAHLRVGITIVTGMTAAGHALLRIQYRGSSGLKSSYFHVDEAGTSVPKFIDGKHDFKKYIDENKKQVIGTIWLPRNDGNAGALMAELLTYSAGKTFTWGGLYHNCWSFGIQIAKNAGYTTPSFGALKGKSPIGLLKELRKDKKGLDISIHDGE